MFPIPKFRDNDGSIDSQIPNVVAFSAKISQFINAFLLDHGRINIEANSVSLPPNFPDFLAHCTAKCLKMLQNTLLKIPSLE